MSSDAKNNEMTAAATGDRGRKFSSPQFASLMAQKRDPDTAARRASFSDQKVGKPGFLGQMWNNFVKGDGSGGTK